MPKLRVESLFMIDELRGILSIVTIGLSLYLFGTHNVSDAIYFGVMAVWVRPEK